MKTQYALPVFAFLIAASLAACASPETQQPPPPTSTLTPQPATATPRPFGGRVEKGQITSKGLANNLIGDPDTRDYYVYLPQGYDTSGKRYPVVYVLHWFGGDATQWVGTLPNAMDWLIDKAEVKDMILVFPDGSNKFGGSEYMSSPTIGDYETYIAKELVAQIDSTYRTLPSRDSRGITGCSMGGLGSLHLALKYPDVYGVAAPMSGLFIYLEDDPGWQRSWKQGRRGFHGEPRDLADFSSIDMDVQGFINLAAVAAPNPAKPPYFLDMPFKIVNGQAEINQEVFQKINHLGLEYDVPGYISQPVRLNALLIYRDTNMGAEAVDREWATQAYLRFDKLLTDSGVDHVSAEVEAIHCAFDYTPVLKFMDAHLAFQ